jgi:transcriptional regulator with XRE-family HTH domain
LDINLKTPRDFRLEIAAKAKAQRLSLDISQRELAGRSGVSLGSVKLFEKSGLISLKSLLEIALVLGRLPDFDNLFAEAKARPSLFAPEPPKRMRSSKKKP